MQFQLSCIGYLKIQYFYSRYDKNLLEIQQNKKLVISSTIVLHLY